MFDLTSNFQIVISDKDINLGVMLLIRQVVLLFLISLNNCYIAYLMILMLLSITDTVVNMMLVFVL